MKYLIPIGLLIIGIVIGYAVGVSSLEKKETIVSNTDSVSTKLIYDTIVTTQIIEVPISVIKNENVDSVIIIELDSNQVVLDTLLETFLEKPIDSIIEEQEFGINKDHKIASKKVSIIYLKTEINEKDSLIKSMLDIDEVKSESIIIEFWESPINYKGYKLSKSKLVVYSLSPQFDYIFYKGEEFYYLNFQSIFYQMVETNEFSPYLQIENIDVD